jgi:hypothetical protein
LLPAQLHFHGPRPLTAEAVPVLQRPIFGMLVRSAPFDAPHEPLISSRLEQLAVEPPFDPAQVQAKGPEPLTADAKPALHRLIVGTLVTSVPFTLPHAPLILS